MKCIGVPDKEHRIDKRLGISDVVIDSLNEINESLWKQVNS